MAKLYGIGVGPGDPELMTLKAVRLIEECPVVAVPASGQAVNTAYTIARGAVPALDNMTVAEVPMPMTKDPDKLAESHKAAAEQVAGYLDAGKDVAFLTLGDPAIYSTYIYIHDQLSSQGYETEMVPGVPSFCAVAARLGEGLTEADQALHIIPASYEDTWEGMQLPGTKVLMKSGKGLKKVKEQLLKHPSRWEAKMVERCGMKGERCFHSAEEIDESASYFSIVVVKDK